MGLVEPGTRAHFGALVEFIDIWDRWLAKTIPAEDPFATKRPPPTPYLRQSIAPTPQFPSRIAFANSGYSLATSLKNFGMYQSST